MNPPFPTRRPSDLACHPASCFGPCCQNTWQHPHTPEAKNNSNPQQADVVDEKAQCRCCWDDWSERLHREEQRLNDQRINTTTNFTQEKYSVPSFDQIFEVPNRSTRSEDLLVGKDSFYIFK